MSRRLAGGVPEHPDAGIPAKSAETLGARPVLVFSGAGAGEAAGAG